MQGVDIMTVKELLGHKTLEMTLRYSHLSPSHRIWAIRKIEKVVESGMEDNYGSNSIATNQPRIGDGGGQASETLIK